MKSLPNIDYNKLINKKAVGPDEAGSVRIYLDDDEISIVKEGYAEDLASGKIVLVGNELWVSEGQEQQWADALGITLGSKEAQTKPVGKYANLKNYLQERSGVEIDETTLDKKLRTFFEDMITEVLKNPAEWDRTRNVNFMELMNYLEGQDEGQPEVPEQVSEEQPAPAMPTEQNV